MRKTNVIIILMALLSLVLIGCGSSSDNNKQSNSNGKKYYSNSMISEDLVNGFKKQGMEVIDTRLVASPDKTIFVTFPKNYIVVRKINTSQYVGIEPKTNESISVFFFVNQPKDKIIEYNTDDNAMQKMREAFKKNNPSLANKMDAIKINNKWFCVTASDGDLGYTTGNNKGTEVSISAPKALKSDVTKMLETLDIQ